MIKKILCASLLCVVQLNFGMEGIEIGGGPEVYVNAEIQEVENVLPPKVMLLEDGHEWTLIEQWQQVKPFAGKVVAWRTAIEGLKLRALKMKKDDPTYFGFIQSRPWIRVLAGIDGYILHKCRPDDCFLVENGISMRLLTLAEARHWAQALKTGDITTAHLLDITETDAADKITLSNLMPSEQKKYFRNQLRETFWPMQRLLHIGSRDTASSLHVLPTEIVCMIGRQAIEDAAEDLHKHLNPNFIVNLE
jgi:hypothetical protein